MGLIRAATTLLQQTDVLPSSRHMPYQSPRLAETQLSAAIPWRSGIHHHHPLSMIKAPRKQKLQTATNPTPTELPLF